MVLLVLILVNFPDLAHENVRHTVSVQVEEGVRMRCRNQVLGTDSLTSWIIFRCESKLCEVFDFKLCTILALANGHLDLVGCRHVNKVSDHVAVHV